MKKEWEKEKKHSKSHKKKHKCDDTNDKCKCNKKLVKDCVCIDWTVPQGGTQTVFQAGGFDYLYSSGLISFECGDSDYITVRFFLGNKQVGQNISVFENSSVAFSFTKFDRITVECPSSSNSQSHNTDEECEGEICIITRYPVL